MAMKTFIFENLSDKTKRHAQLQSALREYTGVDSATVQYTQRGKPYIKGLSGDMYVSVTTADEIMLAVFSEKPVGVDGERMSRFKKERGQKGPDYVSMAERFFSPEEVEYICDGEDEAERFAQVWIRKEAYVKYTGKGLADFPNFTVTDGIKLYSKVNDVTIRRLNAVFPGSSEYLFMVAGGEDD